MQAIQDAVLERLDKVEARIEKNETEIATRIRHLKFGARFQSLEKSFGRRLDELEAQLRKTDAATIVRLDDLKADDRFEQYREFAVKRFNELEAQMQKNDASALSRLDELRIGERLEQCRDFVAERLNALEAQLLKAEAAAMSCSEELKADDRFEHYRDFVVERLGALERLVVEEGSKISTQAKHLKISTRVQQIKNTLGTRFEELETRIAEMESRIGRDLGELDMDGKSRILQDFIAERFSEFEKRATKGGAGVVNALKDLKIPANFKMLHKPLDSIKDQIGELEKRVVEANAETMTFVENLGIQTRFEEIGNAIDSTKTAIEQSLMEKIAKTSDVVSRIETHSSKNFKTLTAIGKSCRVNQIIFASGNGTQKNLSIPGGSQEICAVYQDEHGQLCFKRPNAQQSAKRRIYINTVPKSGTYFIGAILNHLGYQDIEIHAGSTRFSDYRDKTNDEKLYDFKEYYVDLPYEAQASLILPGQYLMGHIDAIPFRNVARDEAAFVSVRDLRHVCVSFFRFSRLRSRHEQVAHPVADELCHFFASANATFLFTRIMEVAAVLNDFPVVRFEELASRDLEIATPSLRVISQITGDSLEDVYDALLRAYGTETKTYTGQLSQLEGVWTPEVEEAFVHAGGDALNESFGYPREYKLFG